MKPLLFIFCVISFKINSQNQEKSYLSNRYSIERMGNMNSGSNTILPGLSGAPPEVLGDQFSKPNFSLTKALLYNGQTINGIYSKYDIINDEFYIQSKQGLRLLNWREVKNYIYIDSVTKRESLYINTKEFKIATGESLNGFFQVVFDGKVALLKKMKATIQKANFNVALNVGSKNHKINKKDEFFYLKDDTVEKLPSPKSIPAIFSNHQAEVEKYIKTNQLSLKDERHLTLIFEYYNQLLSK